MKLASIVIAIVAFVTGLRSAYLWHKASRVFVMPMWENEGRIEPVLPDQGQREWIDSLIATASKSGDFNRKAAFWTAITVVLSTAATLIGAAA